MIFKVEIGKFCEALNSVSPALDKNTKVVMEFSMKELPTKKGVTKRYLQGMLIACNGQVKVNAPFAYDRPTKETELTQYERTVKEKETETGKKSEIIAMAILDGATFKKNIAGLQEVGSVLEFIIDQMLVIKCGTAELHMPLVESVNADIKMPKEYKVAYQISTDELKAALNRVVIASKQDGSPLCQNITFLVEQTGIIHLYAYAQMATTASVKVSKVSVPKEKDISEVFNGKPNLCFAANAKYIKKIMDCCNSSYINLYLMEKNISFQYGMRIFTIIQLSSATLEGALNVINGWTTETPMAYARMERSELMSALKLLSTASGESRIYISKDEYSLNLESAGNKISVDATWSGNFDGMFTNAIQILQYLQVCSQSECIFSFLEGDKSPLRIQEIADIEDETNEEIDESEFEVFSSSAFIMKYSEDAGENETESDETEED